MHLPFSQACENNKEPIRLVLDTYLNEPNALLEIGSGTGQHGHHMTEYYPQLTWQTSDMSVNHEGINAWVAHAGRENFLPPIDLDINNASWNHSSVDLVYTANTLHIMSWAEVEKLFQFVPSALKLQGYLLIYGPFNYDGKFTSDSNESFNQWLKSQAPHRAIRDFEAVTALANEQGLSLVNDHEMPANNRLLVWQFCP